MLFRRAHHKRQTTEKWQALSHYYQLRREIGDSIPLHILPDDECADDATLFDTTYHQAITINIDTDNTQEITIHDRCN